MNGNIVVNGVCVMNNRSRVCAMDRHDGVFLLLLFMTLFRLFGLSRGLFMFLGLVTFLVFDFLSIDSCSGVISRSVVSKVAIGVRAVVSMDTIGAVISVGAISTIVTVGAIGGMAIVSVGAIGVRAVVSMDTIDVRAVVSLGTIGGMAITRAVVSMDATN